MGEVAVHYDTVLVQRNGLLREGLARLLDNSPFRIVGSFPNFDGQVPSVLPQQEPALLLVDIGGDSLERFKQVWPAARFVALAERPDVDEAISVFQAGANAYLAHVTSGDALIKSLEAVMAGATIVPFEILSTILDKNRTSQTFDVADSGISAASIAALSPREKAILAYLAKGHSNKVIARKVDVTEGTVKVHVKAILRKMGAENRTQAVIWALNQGTGFSAGEQAQGDRVTNEPLAGSEGTALL
jgi:two-component system, NarL family, nitrate/nitrite response regulator NarL